MKSKNRMGFWNRRVLLFGLALASFGYSQCENLDLTPVSSFGSEEYSLFFPLPTFPTEPETNPVSSTEVPDQVAPPRFGLPGGTYNSEIAIRLESDLSEGWVFYTLDGSDPNPTSSVYTEPIAIRQSADFVKIRALAVKPGQKPSSIAESSYRVIVDSARPVYQPEPSASIANPLPPDTR